MTAVGIGLHLRELLGRQPNADDCSALSPLRPVQLPVGQEVPTPLSAVLAFNVGRPANLTAGDDQIIALATNLVNLPMPAMGKYVFVLSVNGNPERRLSFRVQQVPGGQMAF
jgi:hypothetical protein